MAFIEGCPHVRGGLYEGYVVVPVLSRDSHSYNKFYLLPYKNFMVQTKFEFKKIFQWYYTYTVHNKNS